jgi:hypothetical protein
MKNCFGRFFGGEEGLGTGLKSKVSKKLNFENLFEVSRDSCRANWLESLKRSIFK